MRIIIESLLSRIHSSRDFDQLVYSLRSEGIRFLPIKYLQSIGHLAIESDCLAKDLILGRRPQVQIILLAPEGRVANKHYAQYWDKYFHVETDPTTCRVLQPLAEQKLLQEDIDDYVMNDQGTAHVYLINALWGHRPPLLSVSEQDRERGVDWLRRQGVSPDSWFVCIHARENGGRVQDVTHYHRNVDITTYIPALKEIISRGGWCIRMGDSQMTPLPPIQGVIDYALHPDKSEWLDVFLFGTCRFFLGCNSGPSSLVASFGIPSILTNITPMSVCALRETDLGIYKRLWLEQERRYLTFTEVLNSRWSYANTFAQDFQQAGLRIEDNSEEEILEVVIEMLDRLDNKLCYSKQDENLQSWYRSLFKWGHYGFGSEARVGKRFLERCSRDEKMKNGGEAMERIIIETRKPVAFDSPDHIQPWGTARDDSTNPAFNNKLAWWLAGETLNVLDIGCAGGGFVKSILDQGGFAIGVEGSDYSRKIQRAQWATIPDNLFTCDATETFELFRVDGRGERDLLKFNVITAWEFIEHISEANLPSVLANIDRHLARNGVVIMSVSPNEEVIDGVKLHLCVHESDWWYRKFDELGFENHKSAVSFFGNDMVRWESNAPGSFHVVLTRKGERLPHPARLSLVGWEYSMRGDQLYVTKEIVRNKSLVEDKISIIEVGTRGSFDNRWRIYEDQVELIGFEPNSEKCTEFNARLTDSGRVGRFFPTAVASYDGEKKVYKTRNAVASSFLTPNWPLVERFNQSFDGQAVEESIVKTVQLDTFSSKHGIEGVDFLKINAEGSELEILKGAKRLLQPPLFGVSVTAFFQPYRIDQPLFPEIHAFLEAHGFSLFSMQPEYWRRGLAVSGNRADWYAGGQLMRAEVVYLRDYIRLLQQGNFDYRTLRPTKILKAISIAEVLGFADYAVELLSDVSEAVWC